MRTSTHTHTSFAIASTAVAAITLIGAWPRLATVIGRSALSPSAQTRAKELFHRLGEVEAAIHQVPLEKIHLHEVGALDSIIDIVGSVFALEWFRADRMLSSPLNVGGGMVQSAHGHFPVPAPATVKLLDGVPVYSSGRSERARHANRRVAGDRVCLLLWPGTINDCRTSGLWRRRSRSAEYAERPSSPRRREHRPAGNRAHSGGRMRDRRHEPAAFRLGDGSSLRRGGARSVLCVGADEEESSRHAADDSGAPRTAAGPVGDRVSRDDDDRRALPRSDHGSDSSAKSCRSTRRSARSGSSWPGWAAKSSTRRRSSRTVCVWPPTRRFR